jgi:hypothetical protein
MCVRKCRTDGSRAVLQRDFDDRHHAFRIGIVRLAPTLIRIHSHIRIHPSIGTGVRTDCRNANAGADRQTHQCVQHTPIGG